MVNGHESVGESCIDTKFSPHYFGGQNCLGSVGNFLSLLFLNITSKFIAFVPNFYVEHFELRN